MVLLHRDFGVCNIMVDETTCNLVGVIDWAEAEDRPLWLQPSFSPTTHKQGPPQARLDQIRRLRPPGGDTLGHVAQGGWRGVG
ncbi:hypothetical protein BJY01DRAFT_220169 [Aspergillus pseudoustus]|uniref:Aminoglycoside phosphotransferase domain-containing protein n=1 Tax=Aspergillus pseudoustus TaxID=1810923 RepID=A0ABR4JDZ1_9EURO